MRDRERDLATTEQMPEPLACAPAASGAGEQRQPFAGRSHSRPRHDVGGDNPYQRRAARVGTTDYFGLRWQFPVWLRQRRDGVPEFYRSATRTSRVRRGVIT